MLQYLEATLAGADAFAQTIHAQHALARTAPASVVQVSDTTLCRQAVAAVDSARRRDGSMSSPDSVTVRAVYLFRVGPYLAAYELPYGFRPALPSNPVRILAPRSRAYFSLSSESRSQRIFRT